MADQNPVVSYGGLADPASWGGIRQTALPRFPGTAVTPAAPPGWSVTF